MRILVISPHPDDEALGCGGSLYQHVQAGDPVQLVFLTSGERGGNGEPAEETARLREQEALAAAAELGISEIAFWKEPDGGLAPRAEIVERLRSLVAVYDPGIIYVPHSGEEHPDHRAANRLVRMTMETAAHPLVLQYEVWTPLAAYDRVVDISEHFSHKLRAIRKYQSQCSLRNYVEGFRGLASYRGALYGTPGCRYAEVFARMIPDQATPAANQHNGAS